MCHIECVHIFCTFSSSSNLRQLMRYESLSEILLIRMRNIEFSQVLSSLLRTVWSVLDRTPKELLHEVRYYMCRLSQAIAIVGSCTGTNIEAVVI